MLGNAGAPYGESAFPRSRLFQLIQKHPVATAATVVATVCIGSRRLGRFGLAGLNAAHRNLSVIAPLLEQLAGSRFRR
jgi:hypothetical protein